MFNFVFSSLFIREAFMKKSIWFIWVAFAALLLAGCGAAEEAPDVVDTGEAETGNIALQITGMVDTPKAWTEDEVRAMETMEAVSTNRDGEEETYTGVSLNALLDEAGVQDGATTVVFVADDGYEAEVALDEIRGCSDCIVSFRSQGGFSTVLPGFPGNVQVKGVIEIKVQ
jgi:hypothetical protein